MTDQRLHRVFVVDVVDLLRMLIHEHSMLSGLQALGTAATLARGYAVARRPDGRIVRDSGEVAVGEALEIVLAAGRLGIEVQSTSDEAAEELLA